MPADVRNPAASRRTFRKLSTEEEIEIRRARGEISCAECRRLKLKCDKKLPCGSCVRRGCSSVCPNGSLTTGQGTRFVLADTEQLHRKISEMGQRIRQLEDALAIFQAGVSTETHTLLRDELLAVKFGPEVSPAAEPEPSRDATMDPMDAFGTLTIGDQGESKYFGRSAGSETLLLVRPFMLIPHTSELNFRGQAGAELEMDYLEDDSRSKLPPDIQRLASIFPLGTGQAQNSEKYELAMKLLFECLPSRPRAWTLCETYMEQASWIFRPLKRDEIVDDILTPIYNAKKEREDPNIEQTTHISPHKLAVLFMLFAQGALVDLTLPPYNIEAERYHHYGRAALSLRSIFDSPVIESIQAIVLLAYYYSNAGKRYTLDSVWTLLSLGAKMAESIGLHRDSARWNMEKKVVERRRTLFWEIFSADNFHSLALGRPPSIALMYVDCELPEDDGKAESQFWNWKYMFSREVFSKVIELTLSAKPPSYETVLELDRKVREKALPESLNVFMNKDDDYRTPLEYMRGSLLAQYRSVTMLYIHRSFFAQAVLDHPMNPLRSPYAPSFLAAYRCASVIIKQSILHFDRFPDLCMRWWSIWTHLFSAAIIVGSIVTRAPSSTMAPSAFIELGLAVDLFEKGAKHSQRARSGMSILTKLRDKAFIVYAQFRGGAVSPPPSHVTNNSHLDLGAGESGGADELAIFGGQTRVLVSRLLTNKSPNWDYRKNSGLTSPSSVSSQPVSTPAGSVEDSSSAPKAMDDIHPSVMDYMSLFPPSAFAPGFNMYPEVDPVDQAPINWSGVSALPQFSTPAALSDYSYPPSLIPHQPQSQPQPGSQNIFEASGPSSAQYPTSSIFGGFAQTYSALTPESVSSPGSATDHLTDLGMMMNGDSVMDEQWISFMRVSGILDSNSVNVAG